MSEKLGLEFKKFDEAGLRPLANRLARGYRLAVDRIEATNQIKRESGWATKTAKIFFQNGQSLELRVKPDDVKGLVVFSVKINGKAFPVKAMDDMDSAIKEIATTIKGNEDRFLAARDRKLAQVAKRETGEMLKKERPETMEEKVAKVRAEADQLEADAKAITDKTGQLADEVAKKRERVQELEGMINMEVETKAALLAEIGG